ncbi:MAG: FG-GAP-like repeat-containing protein [Candidatus Zixiibacteriota bacterium]
MRNLVIAGAICVLFAFTAEAAVEGPLFKASVHYPVGYEPIDICIADFNADGINDLACAQYSGDSIAVLIGQGDGVYETAAFYTIGTSQYYIEAANIDNDSDIDLVVATYNNIYTLDNAGDGTFGAATQISGLTTSPRKFKLADIDGDADNDLIVAHYDYAFTDLTVWTNDGSGNFTLDNAYTVGTYQSNLVVADFDGDTFPDIAVSTGVPNYSILLNDGSGAFVVDNTYALGNYASSICTADFDGDTDLDIAITWYNGLAVYANDGNGAFSSHSSSGVTGSGYGLSAVDLDGVNGPDLAAVDDSVYVYYNNGSGAFTSTRRYFFGDGGEALAVGKLDDDDNYDLAIGLNPGNYGSAASYVALLFNTQGDGDFEYPAQSYTNDGPQSLCMADFNHDGNIDVATLDWWNDSVLVLTGDGTGHFARFQITAVGNSPYEIVAADVDAQNQEDLIIGHSDATQNYITVLLSRTDGTFGAPATYACDLRPRGVFVGELNGSGLPDIATVNSTGATISVLFNNNNGTFAAATNYPVISAPGHSAIDGGDLDGDGSIDLVIPNYTNHCVQAFFNNGSGDFSTSGNIAIGDIYYPYQVCVNDLDSDGYADIIVGSYDSSEVCVIMNNGSGFDATQYYYAGYEQYEIDVSDFDCDGNMDFVVLNTESYNFSVFLGDGAGNFGEPMHYGITSDDSEGMAIADFNNDGYPDVAVSNYNHDNISVMLNRYTILTPVTEIVYGDPVPDKFMLRQNYPNPFNPTTTIAYSLPTRAEVRLDIYNLLGQRVRQFDEGLKTAGNYELVWDGKTDNGRSVATGLYLYKITAGDYSESRKMLLIK